MLLLVFPAGIQSQEFDFHFRPSFISTTTPPSLVHRSGPIRRNGMILPGQKDLFVVSLLSSLYHTKVEAMMMMMQMERDPLYGNLLVQINKFLSRKGSRR